MAKRAVSGWIKAILALGGIAVAGSVIFQGLFTVPSQPQVADQLAPLSLESQCIESASPTSSLTLDDAGQLDLLVWNSYKQQRESWLESFERYTLGRELVLLEEARFDRNLQRYFEQHLEWFPVFVNAFQLLETPAGVMNLATIPATQSCGYLAMEPWLRLPKSSLISQYPLSNGEQLMVANLHGVNFTYDVAAQAEQLAVLAEKMSAHQGPLILAGDFNTWSEARMVELDKVATSLGLTAVSFSPDHRLQVLGMPLDHIYYRGLTLETAEAPETDASDHSPMLVSFSLLAQPDGDRPDNQGQ